MPAQNRSWLQSPVSATKPFCMEMTGQAQERSRPSSPGRYRVDNISVMLKRVSPIQKNTSENGNFVWMLLGTREVTLPGCPAQGSEPFLATGFHVPAQVNTCAVSNLNRGKAVGWWIIFTWNISTVCPTWRCLLISCRFQVNVSLRSGLKETHSAL